MAKEKWVKEIEVFCEKYNVPIEYLPQIAGDLKVIPMIRGKAFEFSTLIRLRNILNKRVWLIEKPNLNPQRGFEDADIVVTHIKSKRKIRVECKLSKNNDFSVVKDNHYKLRVKCMRSRTLGEEMIKVEAPKLGVSVKALRAHKDSYRGSSFDLVITSIGNAFYKSNTEDGLMEWAPTKDGDAFLECLKKKMKSKDSIKNIAFDTMLGICSKDLVPGGIAGPCPRRNCKNKNKCGFIPNYPNLLIDYKKMTPKNGWFFVEDIEKYLLTLVKKK